MEPDLDFCELGTNDDINKRSSVQVWGIGNVLRGDDGAGVAAALRVGGIDCGTTPENYISKLRRNPPETLILIDAVEMNEPPGTVKIFNFDELGGIVLTSHGVPLKAILEPFCERTKIYLIGIQPQQTELGEGLSPEVATAVENIEDYITQIYSSSSAVKSPRNSARRQRGT